MFFFIKFAKVMSFLRRSIKASAHFSVVLKYILVVFFFTGNRASDLGRFLAEGILLKFTIS